MGHRCHGIYINYLDIKGLDYPLQLSQHWSINSGIEPFHHTNHTNHHQFSHYKNTTRTNLAIMKIAAATLAFISLAASIAVPVAEPNTGMSQRLHPRSVTGELIVGRSFSCPSNDPDICCAVSLELFSQLPLKFFPIILRYYRFPH